MIYRAAMKHLREFKDLFESVQELTQEQKDWLDKCTKESWGINPKTGLVDVDEDFSYRSKGLRDFKGVRFGVVGGGFYCDGNRLTSLDGAPQEVGGIFVCDNNRLTSLEGAPRKVGGSFSCSGNELTTLEGAPLGVGDDFDCSYNSLTTLKGAPQVVVGGFDCNYNQLTTLKGAPQEVRGSFYCQHNQLTSLEGAPLEVRGNFYCNYNPISEIAIARVLKGMRDNIIPFEQAVSLTWKDIPEEDRAYLAKHHPDLSPQEKREYEALGRHRKRII